MDFIVDDLYEDSEDIDITQYQKETKLKPIPDTGREEPAYALHTESQTVEIFRENSARKKPGCRVIISTSKLVRDGDVLESGGINLRNYKNNDVVLMCHNYRSTPIANSPRVKVARGNKRSDDVLVGEPEFHLLTDISREAWALVSEGVMKAWSIGFIPLRIKRLQRKEVGLPDDRENDEGEIDLRNAYYRITSADLLEYSLVPVPADPGALTEAIREFHQGGRSLPAIEALLRDAGVVIPELVKQEIKVEASGTVGIQCTPPEETLEVRADESVEEPIDLEQEAQERPEETAKFIHIPVKDKNEFNPDSFKTINVASDQGIAAVAGKLKGGNGSMVIQKYLFEKDKGWTMPKAKAWVKKHKRATQGVVDALQECGQDIRDYEIAYGEVDGCRWLFPVPVKREEEVRVMGLDEVKKLIGLDG